MPSAGRTSGTSWSTRPARRTPISGSWSSSPSASPPTRSGRPICWQLARTPGKTLYDVLFSNGKWTGTRSASSIRTIENLEAEAWLLHAEGAVRGVCRLRPRARARPGAIRTYHQVRGLRWPWSTARRPAGATAKGSIPMSRRARASSSTEPGQEGRDLRPALRAAAGSAGRGIRFLAGHRQRAGTLAFGLHDHAGARALQGLFPRAHAS